MAGASDVFVPLIRWFTVATKGECVAIELTWSETEADFRAGRVKEARIFLPASKARQFAAAIIEQAAIAEPLAKLN
ncbi:MAG: hypothetical protein JO001_25000 [Alphaproteobacteria bacterium]|nr:hypothetical protein [Alphaproteobacteria bacterium]